MRHREVQARKLNLDPVNTLKIGCKVVSCFYMTEADIIRTLTDLKPSLLAEGGLASADGGVSGTPIVNVSAAWFLPVEIGDLTDGIA